MQQSFRQSHMQIYELVLCRYAANYSYSYGLVFHSGRRCRNNVLVGDNEGTVSFCVVTSILVDENLL